LLLLGTCAPEFLNKESWIKKKSSSVTKIEKTYDFVFIWVIFIVIWNKLISNFNYLFTRTNKQIVELIANRTSCAFTYLLFLGTCAPEFLNSSWIKKSWIKKEKQNLVRYQMCLLINSHCLQQIQSNLLVSLFVLINNDTLVSNYVWQRLKKPMILFSFELFL
jgi:hypothetical protein